MKAKVIAFGLLVCLLGLFSTANAQQFPYTCASGITFDNEDATRIYVVLRPGTYTMSALGLDGFDPQMAVVTQDGTELACADDTPAAATDHVNLPGTGEVAASDKNTQLTVNLSGANFFYVYVLVTSAEKTPGSFVFLFGKLRATQDDGHGDPVEISITRSMRSAAASVTAYMIAYPGDLDPLIRVGTGEWKPITLDGQALACDDAATLVCFGESEPLTEATVDFAGTSITADAYDAMLTVPYDVVDRVKSSFGYLVFLMSRDEFSRDGEYIFALHLTLGDGLVE